MGQSCFGYAAVRDSQPRHQHLACIIMQLASSIAHRLMYLGTLHVGM